MFVFLIMCFLGVDWFVLGFILIKDDDRFEYGILMLDSYFL